MQVLLDHKIPNVNKNKSKNDYLFNTTFNFLLNDSRKSLDGVVNVQ